LSVIDHRRRTSVNPSLDMHRYHLEIDGRRFAVDVQDIEADRYQVSVEGQRFEVALSATQEIDSAAGAPAVPATSSTPTPRVTVARGVAAPAARPVALNSASSGAVLRAPMPGSLLRLSVVVGAQVQRGQDIAVLEAMKMENIIRAPHAGTITEICAQAGQQLAHGDVIVRYSRSEEAAP
jgi:glutaconyl-CoA/methylmalonyl-CoA decarboxylase subunit gamma